MLNSETSLEKRDMNFSQIVRQQKHIAARIGCVKARGSGVASHLILSYSFLTPEQTKFMDISKNTCGWG